MVAGQEDRIGTGADGGWHAWVLGGAFGAAAVDVVTAAARCSRRGRTRRSSSRRRAAWTWAPDQRAPTWRRTRGVRLKRRRRSALRHVLDQVIEGPLDRDVDGRRLWPLLRCRRGVASDDRAAPARRAQRLVTWAPTASTSARDEGRRMWLSVGRPAAQATGQASPGQFYNGILRRRTAPDRRRLRRSARSRRPRQIVRLSCASQTAARCSWRTSGRDLGRPPPRRWVQRWSSAGGSREPQVDAPLVTSPAGRIPGRARPHRHLLGVPERRRGGPWLVAGDHAGHGLHRDRCRAGALTAGVDIGASRVRVRCRAVAVAADPVRLRLQRDQRHRRRRDDDLLADRTGREVGVYGLDARWRGVTVPGRGRASRRPAGSCTRCRRRLGLEVRRRRGRPRRRVPADRPDPSGYTVLPADIAADANGWR
ncbi:MAG: hypothetical protein U0470_13625 [Anaerolineae bacterium]